MLPSAPLVITIVSGGAGCMKCSPIHTTAISSSTNGPYVSAASRQEIWEILRRGMRRLRTLIVSLRAGAPQVTNLGQVLRSPTIYPLARPDREHRGRARRV